MHFTAFQNHSCSNILFVFYSVHIVDWRVYSYSQNSTGWPNTNSQPLNVWYSQGKCTDQLGWTFSQPVLYECRMLRQGWSQETNVANTSHRYCVNFIGCRSDDELNSRLPASYTKCCQAKHLAIWPTIFISPQKVLLAPSGPLRWESAPSLVFTVVLVTDDLLQLDHVSGTTYLPVCETRKSAVQNSENNWKHSCFRRTAAHRDFFDYCAL